VSIVRVEKTEQETSLKVGGKLLSRWFLAVYFFDPEDGSDTFLRNFG
jgi:hypothetical protein